MYLNGFSVRVQGGVERAHGYVVMAHGQTYKIVVANHVRVRCDANVRIDGKDVGTWRLHPNQNIVLERPANEPKLFTFYRAASAEGARVGVDVDREDQGLLSVAFTPEAQSMTPPEEFTTFAGGPVPRSFSGTTTQNASAGVTGLTGESSQRFSEAAHMSLDHNATQTITLRLVCDDEDPAPLRPISSQSTPVPPRVGS
jgi:hypothetical protein